MLIGKPSFETSACWTDVNNILAGELAMKYLYECGMRKIAFIGGRKTDHISQMRFGEANIDTGYQLTREILSVDDIPDGIVCENSLPACGVVKAIKEAGLLIPKDISFICFDNYPFSFMIDPLPTVVDIDVSYICFILHSV